MDSLTGIRRRRFSAVNAAHHFLVDVLPLREPESRTALEEFTKQLKSCRLPDADIEVVLLRCLAKLDARVSPRPGALVHQYLSRCVYPRTAIESFRECIEAVMQYRAVGNPVVSQAIDVLTSRYADSELRQAEIATAVGVKSSELARAFKRYTGLTLRSYLRNVRLDRSASMLAASRKSIKEVWASVGYNHPSNFVHDFKRRFHVSPREFRSRSLVAFQLERPVTVATGQHSTPDAIPRKAGLTVLLVDDDEGTRETVGRYLTIEGYKVTLVSTGQEGLLAAERIMPDSILLDFHLPDIDGMRCLRSLRQNPATANARVVLISADWDIDDYAEEIRALGATVHSKLCDLEDIQRLIQG